MGNHTTNPWRNMLGFKVLTVWCEVQRPEQCAIACTNAIRLSTNDRRLNMFSSTSHDLHFRVGQKYEDGFVHAEWVDGKNVGVTQGFNIMPAGARGALRIADVRRAPMCQQPDKGLPVPRLLPQIKSLNKERTDLAEY